MNRLANLVFLGGIATDAAHSSSNKLTHYWGIELQSGDELFIENIGNQTVNIAEFLAVVHAAKFIIETDYNPKIIYTDSITALTWFKNKQTASRKRYVELKKAELFLKIMSFQVGQIEVRHWNNRSWGEIPADFGNKEKIFHDKN